MSCFQNKRGHSVREKDQVKFEILRGNLTPSSSSISRRFYTFCIKTILFVRFRNTDYIKERYLEVYWDNDFQKIDNIVMSKDGRKIGAVEEDKSLFMCRTIFCESMQCCLPEVEGSDRLSPRIGKNQKSCSKIWISFEVIFFWRKSLWLINRIFIYHVLWIVTPPDLVEWSLNYLSRIGRRTSQFPVVSR